MIISAIRTSPIAVILKQAYQGICSLSEMCDGRLQEGYVSLG